MRTTLTLDDDLAKELTKLARRLGVSFKEVVNDAIRRGISMGNVPTRRRPPSSLNRRPADCGPASMRPG